MKLNDLLEPLKYYKVPNVSKVALLLTLQSGHVLIHPEDGRHHGDIFKNVQSALAQKSAKQVSSSDTRKHLLSTMKFESYIPYRSYIWGNNFSVAGKKYFVAALSYSKINCVVDFDTGKVLFNESQPNWNSDLTEYLK